MELFKAGIINDYYLVEKICRKAYLDEFMSHHSITDNLATRVATSRGWGHSDKMWEWKIRGDNIYQYGYLLQQELEEKLKIRYREDIINDIEDEYAFNEEREYRQYEDIPEEEKNNMIENCVITFDNYEVFNNHGSWGMGGSAGYKWEWEVHV